MSDEATRTQERWKKMSLLVAHQGDERVYTLMDTETDAPVCSFVSESLNRAFDRPARHDAQRAVEELRNYVATNLGKITRAKLLDVIDASLPPTQAAPAKRLMDNAVTELRMAVEERAKELKRQFD